MTTSVRRFPAAALVAFLAISVAPLTMNAADTSAPSTWLPGLRASEAVSGPDLIGGRLVDRVGRGVPGRLLVLAWPTSEVLSGAHVGGNVKTIPVAKATAGRDGHFTLRVDPRAPIGEFMERDGTVNFTLVGQFGTARDRGTSFAFPRRFERHSQAESRWVDPGWSPMSGPPGRLEVTLSTVRAFEAPRRGLSPQVPSPDDFGCPNFVRATYDQVVTVVGETYPGPNATVKFTYQKSSESTLGVGASATGSYGSFSASGTSSRTSTAMVDYPGKGVKSKFIYESTYQYKKFEVWVPWDFGCMPFDYEARPTAYQGAVLGYNACCAPVADTCSVVAFPSTLTKDSASAITFSNGVKLTGPIGIDLSAKTGFTTTTKAAYTFIRPGRLCGEGVAWPDAYRVVGK
jgi:hypothetical protein